MEFASNIQYFAHMVWGVEILFAQGGMFNENFLVHVYFKDILSLVLLTGIWMLITSIKHV